MRGSTRVKWVVGASAIALAASACGGGSSGSGAPAGYYTASSTEPQNPLQPANANETGGAYPLEMLFRGLYTYDPRTGAPVPAMAADFQSTDAQNYTIRIKPGWTFHNGEPVTAKSYVDAWNWGANSANKQINASWFSIIEGYDAVHPEQGNPTSDRMSGLNVVDDTTFTVKLKQPVSSFKAQLAYYVWSPLPQQFYTDPAKYGQQPIGNGPFALDLANGGWQHKQSITLKRYENYAGDDKARSAGARLVFYTTYDAAYTALRDNKLDVIDQMPESAVAGFQKDLGARAVVQPQMSVQKVGFPLYDAAWNTPGAQKVRQGLSMAIDRKAITQAIYQGMEIPAFDWLAPGVPGHADVCGETCTYNPTRAKQLIAEGGGIPGGKMTISYNADGPHKTWVDAVCNSINQTLGTTACEGKAYPEFGVFRSDVTNKKMTSAYRTGWKGDYPFPDNFLNDIYRTGAASNDSGYSNPTFDRLAGEAMADPNTEGAVARWQQSERELVRDLPSIPLWYYVTKAGYSTNVTNVTFDPFGTPVWAAITKK
jgi:ABC-type oligopeptide transport system substrate-binding subunit